MKNRTIVQGIFLALIIFFSIAAQEVPQVPLEFASVARGEEFLFQKTFRLEDGDEFQVGFFFSQPLERIRAAVFKADHFVETISPHVSLSHSEDIAYLKNNLADIEKHASIGSDRTLYLMSGYLSLAFSLAEDSMPLFRYYDAFELAMLKKDPEWGHTFAYSGFDPAGLLKAHRIISVRDKSHLPGSIRYLVGLDGSVSEVYPETLLTAYRMENLRFPKSKDRSDMFEDFIRQLHDGHGKLISDVRTIPGYFARRLPEDLEMAVRPPWSYNGGDGKCHVFYVYESDHDRVIRYVITFASDGTPVSVNEIILGSVGHTKIII